MRKSRFTPMTCVSTDSDWDSIENAFKVFSSVSGSKLNLVKSCGLWVGSWRSRQDRPLGVQWSAESIRILGVNLFGDYHQTVKDNWDSVYYRSQRSLAYCMEKTATFVSCKVYCHAIFYLVKSYILVSCHSTSEAGD